MSRTRLYACAKQLADAGARLRDSREPLRQHDLIALFQGDDGLLPIRGLAGLLGALATVFAPDVECIDPGDFYFEEILNRLANLRLVRARIGHDRILIVFLAL